MNKKVTIIIVVILIILLTPIRHQLKDGGSIEYKSILYTVTDVKRISLEFDKPFEEGLIIEILGQEVYSNIK